MPDTSKTKKTIVKQSDKAKAALAASEREIKDKMSMIYDDIGPDGATADQKAKRKSSKAARDVLDARDRLAVLTAELLDDSDDVAALAKQLKWINDGIQEDLDDLKDLVDTAEQIAATAKYIAEITATVAGLAATLTSASTGVRPPALLRVLSSALWRWHQSRERFAKGLRILAAFLYQWAVF